MKHIFIINPVAGLADKTEEIRETLAKRDDIEAIVFVTEDAGHETSLMREMLEIFDDEDVRICVCGGSGTLSNVVDAIDVSDMDHVEVAYYPCGLTNDFLKNFGDSGSSFNDLNEVLDGETTNVDYIRCVVDGNDHNIKNELLFATVGIAANVERTSRVMRFLGGLSPAFLYGLATLFAFPFSPAIDYEVIIDGVDYSREYKLLYIGNSVCMGGAFVPIKNDINCRDGYMNVLLLKKIPPFHLIRYLTEFMHGELANKHGEDASIIKCKEIFIRRKDGRIMNINADGEILSSYSWNMKIVSGRMKFVVPKNAHFIESSEELIKCMGLC